MLFTLYDMIFVFFKSLPIPILRKMKGSKFGRYKKVYFKFKNYLSILIFHILKEFMICAFSF